jgi:FkbM family methyltransferase
MHFLRKMAWHRPFDLIPAVRRRLREELSSPPSGMATTWFKDVRFDVDTSLHAITRKYYFQTHEMFLDAIFRKYLPAGSTFIDVGANMGYWSAKAASLVGKSGAVHSFEPVPPFFVSVHRLAASNPKHNIYANNLACGAQAGQIEMAVVVPDAANYSNFDTNIGSSSALPGFLAHEPTLTQKTIVNVIRLDDYIQENNIDLGRVGLIKIDVEGYESFCLDGMKNTLSKQGKKVPILCEVLTDTARSEFLDARKIIERMCGHGYRVLDATTLQPIDVATIEHEENILCV